MQKQSYIYTFKYDIHNSELFALETRQIFGKEATNKMLFSDLKIDPSISPFIKNRFHIISTSDEYSELIVNVKKENICMDGFKAEYLLLKGDSTGYIERLDKLRDIGYCIDGDPDYVTPTIIYSICYFQGTWHFGILEKHNTHWYQHKQKPCSLSSSINMDIAKSLVCIASQGNKAIRLIDPCCGVGTVLLEACIGGFSIEGCDINWKACKYSRENLAHYNYSANVFRTDINDHNKQYDAAIIDLPYNLYTYSTNTTTLNIIQSTAKLCDRLVIVSISDIESIINQSGLKVSDYGTVDKKGKSKFKRMIWVCKKA